MAENKAPRLLMISRFIETQIKRRLDQGKVIVLTGARQVGKTTLTTKLLENYPAAKTLIFNGDNLEAQKLSRMSSDQIRAKVLDHQCLLIDEAHKINRIGDITKSLVDEFGPDLQIILTGSSTINLIDQTSESLTGRKRVFELYPIAVGELGYSPDELSSALPLILQFGLYPEVVNEKFAADKKEALWELAQSSIYRDVLDVTGARASGDLVALLRYLATNIGQTLSVNEASKRLSIDRRTIDRYVELLTKSYIVFPLYPYSQRGSISRAYKVYFWDVGIRNALADDLTPIADRPDLEAIWQNFVIAEYLKRSAYLRRVGRHYFWRSYDGTEVDLVEVSGQKLAGYRTAYYPVNIRSSAVFKQLKPVAEELITPDNLADSLLVQWEKNNGL